MGAVAERVAERLEDQVALDLVHPSADQRRRCRRSGSAALARLGRRGARPELDRLGVDRVAVASSTARWMVFSSSRTLPRQPWRRRAADARRRESGRCGSAVHVGVAAREMLRERRDVAGPLAQRRDAQGDDVEPEIQILAERAARDLGRQVAVGGGEDADVDLDRRAAAEPVDLALLQHAQQLGLQPHVHLADLVEQQRAAVGRLELADAARAARR